jgi:hypothetical protein
MAHDLILKDNTTNWARGSVVVPIGVLTKVESKKNLFSNYLSKHRQERVVGKKDFKIWPSSKCER